MHAGLRAAGQHRGQHGIRTVLLITTCGFFSEDDTGGSVDLDWQYEGSDLFEEMWSGSWTITSVMDGPSYVSISLSLVGGEHYGVIDGPYYIYETYPLVISPSGEGDGNRIRNGVSLPFMPQYDSQRMYADAGKLVQRQPVGLTYFSSSISGLLQCGPLQHRHKKGGISMPTQVTNYQCPACTGPLHFEGGSGKLECEYCGTSYDVAEIEALYAEKEEKAAAAQQAADEASAGQSTPTGDGSVWDTSGFSEDWGAGATVCVHTVAPAAVRNSSATKIRRPPPVPYCGNPTVVPGQFSGQLRPDFIIPFKLSKEAAVKALKEHYKGKFFLPKSFTRENHVQEIQGIYVPFWMFDGEAGVMPVMRLPAPIHTAPVNMRLPRRSTLTSTGLDLFPLRRSRRMPPARCRTITWTPSSPMTIRS